jgi:Zn-dependent protease
MGDKSIIGENCYTTGMLFGFSISDLITLIASMLIAMTIHEAAHAYVGYKLGDTTAAEEGRITLNPLRHIDPIMTVLLPIVTLVWLHAPVLAARPVPFDPERVRYGEFGAALMAFAGPLSNLALAGVGAILFHTVAAPVWLLDALYIFVSLNVALFIFNLVPIPPLDGSRVLYAFAPEAVQGLMRQVEPIGMFLVFSLVLVGGFGGILTDLNTAVLKFLL